MGEYTYDALSRSTSESATDGAGNSYEYGANNSITSVNGVQLETDECGNTLHYIQDGKKLDVLYDAKNRIHQIGGDENQYHYDVENNRVSMSSQGISMTYTYDTSGGRNRLVWMEDQDNQGTVFVYGADGLMWSKSDGEYKIYHYDYRGSVVAVTDENGNLTDEIRYDAYGSVVGRTGTDLLIIGYNGRDGVLTEPNGLLFMRARYYSPSLKRFMNADIILGSIADPSTLNLYAYVNGNPISYVDPFGLSKEESSNSVWGWEFDPSEMDWIGWLTGLYGIGKNEYNRLRYGFDVVYDKGKGYVRIKGAHTWFTSNANIGGRLYTLRHAANNPHVWGFVDWKQAVKNTFSLTVKGKVNWSGILGHGLTAAGVLMGVAENLQEGTSAPRILTDAAVDVGIGVATTVGSAWATASATAAVGGTVGSAVPIAGTAVGAAAGFVVGGFIYFATDVFQVNGKTLREGTKDVIGGAVDSVVDFVGSFFD